MSTSSSPNSNSPSTTLVSPMELRHMTSNPNVHGQSSHKASNRHSQLLQASTGRLGSKSPVSIPSSPTSVHSSSSAIFERDIEPIPCPSPPHAHHPPNPHRIPRSKTTETIEQSVPSVLDAAASILASSSPDDEDQISVVAPATNRDTMRSSGFASPIGSFRSRSPSPIGSPGNRASLLLSLPQVNPHSPSVVVPLSAAAQTASPALSTATSPQQSSPIAVPRPLIQTQLPSNQSTTPAIVTPTSAYFSTSSSVDTTESSPTTTTREHPGQALPTQSPSGSPPTHPITHSPQRRSPSTSSILQSNGAANSPTSFASSHPPSPTHKANKRLSFMSYSDLLSSTPALAFPLSALTTSASSVEPPPHIPSVSGFTQTASAAASLRDFALGPGGGNVRDRDSIALLDDVGGEWEREGMGQGLEERLEALMSLQQSPIGAT
ncbi:hypothetical protein PC9H_010200 [Pleurotus ostreatus]|uniref:Uncharacterized protein n=1 Tax=Pleurotus ostreatus TaxID=5322 RepID=A0A8H6ZQS6_PLEOS|nr:uncharacterized protein PC9H_010200 [Pleurotus ostreatus]KAF7424889.1 hypothetical protein PC9H_010200 [Pleurotus ostreatus]KAJ8692088.1 hypothetical protein PTI98_009429 [Pleurotus ostreatus]